MHFLAWTFTLAIFAANNLPPAMNGNGNSALPNQAQERVNPFPNPQPPQGGQPPYLNVEAFNQFNALDEDMTTLLRSCFSSQIPTRHDLFSITGNDGTRHVQIMFQFNSDGGRTCCNLEWGVTRTIREEDGAVIPLLMGSIISIDAMNHLPTPLDYPEDMFRIIHIRICGGDNPKWLLNQLYPNGLVSGKFIRTFIARGIHAEALLYDSHVSPNFNIPPVYLEVEDKTEMREEYWLDTGSGKTYFQSWGIEYECILEMSQNDRIALLTVSELAFNRPAAPAFGREDFQSVLSPYADEFYEVGAEYTFHPTFIQEITGYRDSKSSQERQEMTTRDALREFMAMVRSRNYSDDRMASFPQNTFLYFFRTHEDFDLLARQVLSDYDPECVKMRGMPNEEQDIAMQYHYHYSHTRVNSVRQRARNFINPGGGPPGQPPAPRAGGVIVQGIQVQHLQNGFHHDHDSDAGGGAALAARSVGVYFESSGKVVSCLSFSLFIIFCIILIMNQNARSSDNHHFDVYSEL